METRSYLHTPSIRSDVPLGLEGYAAVFNSPSRVLTEKGRTFREVILPGAFTRSLKQPILGDVVALWQHDTVRPPLGRTPTTLRLLEDAHGLRFEIDLPESAKDIHEAVRRGDVRGVSFGMRNEKATWSVSDGFPLRTITDLDMLEMSLVVHPAYPATMVASRSLCVIPDTIGRAIDLARQRLLLCQI